MGPRRILAIYVALVFATLPWTAGALVGLERAGAVDLVITSAYLGVAAVVVHRVALDHRLPDAVAFICLAALALAAGALFLGLTVPEERVHFLEYAVLAGLVRRALPTTWATVSRYGAVIGACVAVAALDELAQYILPSRVGDMADVGLDVFAALCALIFEETILGRLGRLGAGRDETWTTQNEYF